MEKEKNMIIYGKLIFEGEYLKGKKWNGKGKEYDFDRKLKFEGEYLNGRKFNKIGYNINGNMDFQIKDGKINIKNKNSRYLNRKRKK